jgi:hypothetical protein
VRRKVQIGDGMGRDRINENKVKCSTWPGEALIELGMKSGIGQVARESLMISKQGLGKYWFNHLLSIIIFGVLNNVGAFRFDRDFGMEYLPAGTDASRYGSLRFSH